MTRILALVWPDLRSPEPAPELAAAFEPMLDALDDLSPRVEPVGPGVALVEVTVAWKRTVGMHDDVVRSVLTAFGGREMATAGDSFLVLFDSSEQAIRCGLALVSAVTTIDIAIRVGIHTGEVALTDDNVRGMAVHIASRILDLAGPGEVLVSRITRELAEGTRGLTFESRGPHRLKGVAREHELFAVRIVP